jgi:hypothetical protein
MEEHEIFEDWIRNKKDINPPSGFSSKVIKQIIEYEKNKRIGGLYETLDEINMLPIRILRAVIALGALAFGLFRICYVPFSLFFPILTH